MWRERSATFRYTVYGALFGLAFPVLSTIWNVLVEQLPLTLHSVLQVQRGNPMHWVIDTAPLFLGLFASFAGRRQDQVARLSEMQRQQIQELDQAMSRLETMQASLERRSAQLEAAAQVAREAAGILDVARLLDATVNLVSERFGFYHAGIFLLDEAGAYAVLRAASSEGGQRMLARGHRLQVGEVGIVGYVAGTGEPRIALDVGEDAVFFDNPDLPETRSEMALPLKVHQRVTGVLDVQSKEPGAFSEEDVAVLQALADQVALALQNARLLVEAESRLRETRMLLRDRSREGWKQQTMERPGWGYVYDGVEVLPGEASGEAQMESGLKLPLQVRGQPIGHLDLLLADRLPTSEDIALVQAVAEQASLALENARLFQETQRALAEVETLNAISSTVSRSLELEEVLGEALRQLLRITGFEAGLVSLMNPDIGRLYLVAQHDLPEPLHRRLVEVGLEGTLCDVVYQQRETLAMADLSEGGPVDVTGLMEMGLHSYLGVPLESKGEVVGTICVFGHAPRSLPPTIISLMQAVGQQVGVAVENARLFDDMRSGAERERMVAEITAQIRASTDVETILRTAIRELGRALRVSDGLIRLGTGDGVGSLHTDEGVVEDGSAELTGVPGVVAGPGEGAGAGGEVEGEIAQGGGGEAAQEAEDD